MAAKCCHFLFPIHKYIMNLYEAKHILNANGYILESSMKGDFAKGEKGGEPYFNLSNDYSYSDAKRIFVQAKYGEKNSDESLIDIWNNYISAAEKKQFNKTYEQFEKYKAGEPIKLYRGLVITSGEELDVNKPGECWSFSSKKAKTWAENIWDIMVYNHIVNSEELHNSDKYVLVGETTLDNCRLPYSIWLAGRFERPEWEVRVKDETKVKIISKKIIE